MNQFLDKSIIKKKLTEIKNFEKQITGMSDIINEEFNESVKNEMKLIFDIILELKKYLTENHLSDINEILFFINELKIIEELCEKTENYINSDNYDKIIYDLNQKFQNSKNLEKYLKIIDWNSNYMRNIEKHLKPKYNIIETIFSGLREIRLKNKIMFNINEIENLAKVIKNRKIERTEYFDIIGEIEFNNKFMEDSQISRL